MTNPTRLSFVSVETALANAPCARPIRVEMADYANAAEEFGAAIVGYAVSGNYVVAARLSYMGTEFVVRGVPGSSRMAVLVDGKTVSDRCGDPRHAIQEGVEAIDAQAPAVTQVDEMAELRRQVADLQAEVQELKAAIRAMTEVKPSAALLPTSAIQVVASKAQAMADVIAAACAARDVEKCDGLLIHFECLALDARCLAKPYFAKAAKDQHPAVVKSLNAIARTVAPSVKFIRSRAPALADKLEQASYQFEHAAEEQIYA